MTPSEQLHARARLLFRFSGDLWHARGHDEDGTFWENESATPAMTLTVLETLKHSLRLTWPDAVAAARLLARHPESPPAG